MPKAFNACVKAGGRVRTKTLSEGRYMRICWDKQGKSHAGEIHKKKKANAASLLMKQKT